jgi:hypothetical protein
MTGNSILNQLLPRRGQKMVQFTMSARHWRRAFVNQIRLYVFSLNLCLEDNELIRVQIVFKALIVLHTMIRNGATDNVLSYLSSSEVLRLQNVVGGNWEGQRPFLTRLV